MTGLELVELVRRDFKNAMVLLNRIASILNINTGNNLKTPTSYTHVMQYAATQWLYSSYFRDKFVYNYENNDLTQQAKNVYHYNDKQAKLYSEYRKLGYSDSEAHFESKPNPTFGEWYMLNPVRNIAGTITVLPFLFWTLPYGLFRVHQASRHNAASLKTDSDQVKMQLTK